MKFYNRENELEKLSHIQATSHSHAQMTIITGRRRIGKTQLLLQATHNQPTLYFFVARKAEADLIHDFQEITTQTLGIPIYGNMTSFAELFRFLMEYSAQHPFNLIIDEFQEFFNINSSIYSEMQHYWDINKDRSHINLLLSGSIYSLMHKIFENNKEPLFGRATAKIHLKPFRTNVLKEILSDYFPQYNSEDLLALYAFTGGVAKYVQLFMDNGAYTKSKMLDFMIKEDSLFIPEGKNALIEEFGKDYAVYFSILAAIARGENTRAKIEVVIEKELGGYLSRLEKDFNLIEKTIPILAKVETKNVRYRLTDNFLTFWFRFIFKYNYLIEIGSYKQLRNIIERDYETFSGLALEKYFRTLFIEQENYTRIGGFWDRRGENEIDLIAINEFDKTANIVEIKCQKKNIDMERLREKGIVFKTTAGLNDYQIIYQGLSMEDM